MPPKKKTGIEHLIGKPIRMESKYDNEPLLGVLVSTDNDYLGVEQKGVIHYFSKYVIRCIKEDTTE